VSEYWKICAEEAIDEAGLNAEPSQIAIIAKWMESAHDNYGEQHGHHEANRSLWSDLTRRAEKAEALAAAEAEKVPCPVCANKVVPGLGGTTEPARHTCWYCNETGKVEPHRADQQ
jgi:hypothetical protein